jgi:hypothetical protein
VHGGNRLIASKFPLAVINSKELPADLVFLSSIVYRQK